MLLPAIATITFFGLPQSTPSWPELASIQLPDTGETLYRTSIAEIYVGQDNQEKIDALEASAEAVASVFDQWNFPTQNVLINRTRTVREMRDSLLGIRKLTTPEDRVIIACFSHGVSFASGPRLKLNRNAHENFAIGELVKLVAAIPARHKLLIIDACYSGSLSGVSPGVGMSTSSKSARKDSFAILLTSAPGKYSVIDFTMTKFAADLRNCSNKMIENQVNKKCGVFLSDLVPALQELEDNLSFGTWDGLGGQMLLLP